MTCPPEPAAGGARSSPASPPGRPDPQPPRLRARARHHHYHDSRHSQAKHARAQDKPGHPAPLRDPKSPAPATGYHQARMSEANVKIGSAAHSVTAVGE